MDKNIIRGEKLYRNLGKKAFFTPYSSRKTAYIHHPRHKKALPWNVNKSWNVLRKDECSVKRTAPSLRSVL